MDLFELIVVASTALALLAPVALEFVDMRIDQRCHSVPRVRRAAPTLVSVVRVAQPEPMPLLKAA